MWSSSHTQPLPIGSPPFHLPFLNNLHAHLLSAPQPTTALDYIIWVALPHAFSFPQAYLLTAPRADKPWNRAARFALGVLGTAAVVNSLLSYRLHGKFSVHRRGTTGEVRSPVLPSHSYEPPRAPHGAPSPRSGRLAVPGAPALCGVRRGRYSGGVWLGMLWTRGSYGRGVGCCRGFAWDTRRDGCGD